MLFRKIRTPQAARVARHLRVRKKVTGSQARLRLSVFRSPRHIYAQVIDDATGRTLASASSLDADVRSQLTGKKKTQVAQIVGQVVAQRAKEAGAEKVVLDRSGYFYHGRVQALADAARKGGLVF